MPVQGAGFGRGLVLAFAAVAFVSALLKPMGIKKIARTGAVALFREPN